MMWPNNIMQLAIIVLDFVSDEYHQLSEASINYPWYLYYSYLVQMTQVSLTQVSFTGTENNY